MVGESASNIRQAARWCFALALLAGCTKIEPPVETPVSGLPDLELHGAEVRMLSHGSPKFTVRANSISRMEPQRLLQLDGDIRVDFYDALGRHNAVLNADQGEVIGEGEKLYARGRVTVRSDSGLVLLTDELYYDQRLDRVLSDGFVTIITPTDSLSGYGFSADPDLNDWAIENTSGETWRQVDKTERR